MKSHSRLNPLTSIVPPARFAVAAGLLILGAVMLSVAWNDSMAGAHRNRSNSVTTQANASSDNFNQGPDVDTGTAIVQLKGDPLSAYSSTKPARGKKIDFN